MSAARGTAAGTDARLGDYRQDMPDTKYDVVAIGNAIVDVLAHSEDRFLTEHNLPKGAMTLIDSGTAERLYGIMGAGVEVSGGSAANTVAGVAGLGGKAAFIGKVANDQLGQVFAHDIRASGVAFDTQPLAGGAPTARCLILVTPDAQRTMQTFLGACVELGPEDVDESLIAASQVLYLEGYLWDQPRAMEAFLKAARAAGAAGRKV
jgi:sugar/nucleoside kinase (ribokinase family)